MENKTVLVTGIGGNVGQGILRNIISTKYPIKLIGTNTTSMSAGNHWLDKFYQVPFGYDENYIPSLIKIVKDESVDLIIPSTDFESYYLSINQEKFHCKIACVGKISSKIYLDKYLTYLMHKKYNIPFAESCLPSEFSNQYDIAIAKPRKGRGSRGIKKNITNVDDLNDEEYLVQRQYEGIEITTAVYRRYLDGSLHGIITLERSLENGATTFCRVIKDYDAELKKIALLMIENSDLKGAFNIQSIVTSSGKIIPFEVNCRISGTNSIRSAFGFKDVEYTINELLWKKELSPVQVKYGEAHRFLSDVIYVASDDVQSLIGTNKDSFIEF